MGLADGIYLLTFLFRDGAPPPPPFPEAGPDPTTPLPCESYDPEPSAVDPGIRLGFDGFSVEDFWQGTYTARVELTTTTPGVEGWSFGVEAEGCSILEVSVEGTVAASEGDGGFVSGMGVSLAELDGSGQAFGAVLFHILEARSLPKNAEPHAILVLTVEADQDFTVAEGDGDGAGGKVCLPCTLRIVDGLETAGEPIRTRVLVESRRTVLPLTEELTEDLCPPPNCCSGDCNADGDLDLSDAVAVLRYLFAGTFFPESLPACDANGDFAIQLTDALHVARYLFGGGPPPVGF